MKIDKLKTPSPINKLEQLKIKQAKIQKQLRDATHKISETNRKINTRQRILIGAFIIHLLSDEKVSTLDINTLHKIFEKFITQDANKKIFDFSSKESFLASIL